MTKKYKEYNFILDNPVADKEILIALLAHAGFEGFVETPEGFLAYTYDDILLDEVLSGLPIAYKVTIKEVPEKNWNETWEKQIKPLIIDEHVYIRTSFHPQKEYPVTITIDPKMSFGTGHHETTYLMIKQLLQMDLQDKSVIDMGSGTGVLAILADKLGAKPIFAIDNDKWAFQNALENFNTNDTPQIKTFLGDATILKELPAVDVFLANINRNILLRDMARYVKHIKPNGQLIISGFYQSDVPLLLEEGKKNGMVFESMEIKNDWTSLKFKKTHQDVN